MSYKVVGAAAVVELDDGKSDLGSGRRIYLEQDGAVPPNVKKAHLEHLLNIGLIAEDEDADLEETADEGSTDEPTSATQYAPASSASFAKWKAYAVSQGMSEHEAEASTRDELAKYYNS